MLDVIVDTLLDTVKILPFLYLACLLMEYLEHRAGGAAERWLRGSGKFGPLIGSALGLVPQCGFSAAAAGMYAGRIITLGTLLSVFLATSDEMLPIMISSGAPLEKIAALLALKFGIGLAAGFAVDGVLRLIRRKHPVDTAPCIEDLCEREHCHCERHFAVSALVHTLRLAAFILLFTFLLNTAIYFIGEETIGAFLAKSWLAVPAAALVGLIPNCASSVILTELYMEDVISLGVVTTGLLINAGVGVAVLFRNNRPVKDSFRVTGLLIAVGLVSGFLIEAVTALL